MNRLFCWMAAMALMVGAAHAQWTFEDISQSLIGAPSNATAIAWGDVNNDGEPDLFVGGGSEQSVLFVSERGMLLNRTSDYGLSTLNTRNVYAAEFVDYNRDGYTDLLLLTDDGHGLRLYRQLSNHRFQWVVNSLDIEFTDPIRSTAWVDVNNDGHLDLIISNGGTRASGPMVISNENFELVQNRAAGFLSGIPQVGAIAIEDFDRDGDMDIFLGGVGDEPPHLFRCDNGNYLDWGQRFGLPGKMGSYGAAWLDYNNDQQWDLFGLGEPEHTHLFRGMAVAGTHGLMQSEPVTTMLPALTGARSCDAVDANMDGYPDLFIVKNGLPCWSLLVNQQGERWVDVSSSVGLEPRLPVLASGWADWDHDGDLDLAVAAGTAGLRLYRNNVTRPHEFIVLNLVSPITNAPVPNCSVWMQFESAKAVGSTYRNSSTPGTYGSRVLLVNASNYKSSVATLMVRWPCGETARYDLDDLELGEINTLVEPVRTTHPIAMAGETMPTPLAVNATPNPFNPLTTLSVSLPEAGDVELKVFNLMGQEVATLLSGYLSAGTHRVTFDAGHLPTGLYLSRLTAGGETRINRLLLAK